MFDIPKNLYTKSLKKIKTICHLYRDGYEPDEIAEIMGTDEEKIKEVIQLCYIELCDEYLKK